MHICKQIYIYMTYIYMHIYIYINKEVFYTRWNSMCNCQEMHVQQQKDMIRPTIRKSLIGDYRIYIVGIKDINAIVPCLPQLRRNHHLPSATVDLLNLSSPTAILQALSLNLSYLSLDKSKFANIQDCKKIN